MDIAVFRREPTTDETAEAVAQIVTHESAVSKLQSQIHSLQFQINTLKLTQAEHIRIINKHKGVVTLARRIPPELLARIFKLCVKDGWYRAPLVVSQVCSQWREAARSPRVWSRIYVNLDDANAIGRTQLWLRMASRAPLHVSLTSSWRTSASLLLGAMSLLLSHAPDWKAFRLEANTLQHMQLVALCIMQSNSPFPRLKRLSITTNMPFGMEVDGLEGVSEAIEFADAFSLDRAPNLDELSLTCNIIPPNMTLPQHIRRLKLSIAESPESRPLAANTIVSLLASLFQLTHLCISMPLEYEREFVDDGVPQGLTLSELVSLTLYGPPNMNNILRHFHAPRICALHLRSLDDCRSGQDPIGPSLLRFIQDTSGYFSNSPIEVLELYDIDLPPEYFMSCFTALPNLRELRLHESSIADGTLQLLQAGYLGQESSGSLCPRLSKIDFRWCANLSGRAVVNLLRSRLPDTSVSNRTSYSMPGRYATEEDSTPSPITEVAVINCCYVEEKDIIDLASMAQCRIVVEESDYCATRRCCGNARYRQHLRMRHLSSISAEDRSRIRLII